MSANNAQVQYQVEIDSKQLEITVTMTLSGEVAQGEIRLEIPTWVPGDYSFAPYARDLFNIEAKSTSSNENLTVERDGYEAFLVKDGQGEVTVTYKAYAYAIDFAEPSGILDSDYAILLGTRYLHCPAHLGTCQVDYAKLPDGWEIHHPSGAQREGDSNCWTYPSFEILLDTPVVFGNFTKLRRRVIDKDIYFVFVDKGVGFESNVERFVDKLALAAEKIHAVFGHFPFEDYTFVMTLNPKADWGLEHLTSTMCGLGPDVFVSEDKFAHGIRVCAHEMFHAWNVRRLRPDPLGQLAHHLSDGSFTEGLWVAEGFTRYYEFLISTRANAYTPEQFFSAVVGYYQHLTAQPAYRRVSAIDSSLATYLNHSKYAGRVNNSIDYYDKGMLIAFGLDVDLRVPRVSSLDEAFAAFYHQYVGYGPDHVGYTTDEVIGFFDEFSGLGEKIRPAVTQPQGLDTVQQLEQLGFSIEREDAYYLGIVFENDGAPTIYNVIDESPAGSTGIAPGDVITHVNDFQYTQSALAWAASNEYPVILTVQRGHRQLSCEILPQSRQTITSLVWEGDDQKAQIISDWLDQDDFRPQPGERFSLKFYENFHGIESVV